MEEKLQFVPSLKDAFAIGPKIRNYHSIHD